MFDTFIEKGVEPVRWLLVAGIAYTLAMTIWSFFETPSTQPVASSRPGAQALVERAPVNVNWILSKHLFGEAGAPVAGPVVASNEPSVETRLPLELQSVIVSDDPDFSSAIIAQRGKPGRMYRIGDSVPGNAEVVEITPDVIYLRRAGVRESLSFPSGKFKATQVANSSTNRNAQAGALDDADYDDSDEYLADAEGYAENDAGLDEELGEEIDEYREQFSEDAEGMLERFGIESTNEGYRIGSISQTPYLRQAGLQAGDVILSVNGRPVGDLQTDQLELDNIMAQGSARIEIQRGSRRFFITASIPTR